MKSHFGWLEYIFGGRGNSLLLHLLLYPPCQMIFHSKFGFTVIKCAVSCNASPVLLLHDIMCSVTGRFFSPIFQNYVPFLSQLFINISVNNKLCPSTWFTCTEQFDYPWEVTLNLSQCSAKYMLSATMQ